jgi:reactive intermediate/imine deaminase
MAMAVERMVSSFASYSDAVTVSGPGRWIYVAGQVGLAEDGGGVVEGGVGKEAEAIFGRIGSVLERAGAELSDVVKLNVYLTGLDHYSEFSVVRGDVFGDTPPASAAVQVAGLLLGAQIEIDAVAFVPEGR